MANIVKHIGKFGEKHCVIIFREMPDDKQSCLITPTSSLPDRMHDELMVAVQSPEAQAANSLADILSRKMFSDGQHMINALHYGKHIQKVPVSQVVVTPLPNQSMPLSELNTAISSIEGGYVPPKNDESHLSKSPVKPSRVNTTTEEGADTVSVARNVLMQGQLMLDDAEALRKDAEAKLEEAYAMDPELRPKKRGRIKKEENA